MKTWHASFSGDEQCHKPLLMLLMFLREMRYTTRERDDLQTGNYSGFYILFIVIWMLSQPRGQNMYSSGAEEKKMFSIFQIFVSFQFSLGRSCEMWNMHDTPREHANTYVYESFWGQFSVFNLSKISQRFSIFSLPRSSSLWILYAFHFIRNVGSIHRFAFHFLILLRIRGTINQQTESSTHAHFHSIDFRLSTCSSRPPLLSSLLCVAIFRTIFESRKFIRRRLRSKT